MSQWRKTVAMGLQLPFKTLVKVLPKRIGVACSIAFIALIRLAVGKKAAMGWGYPSLSN